MERREMLKIMATSLGGSLAIPQSAFAKMGQPFDPAELTLFTKEQRRQAAMIAEAILPETDTPGAIEAGVPGWIEVIVKDCYGENDQKTITSGIDDFAQRCQHLTKVHTESLAAQRANGKRGRTFLQHFKELTKFCYASSEVGAQQAFDFVFVPGQWIPAMPLTPDQKVWAL